jgi:hypothetical protein
VLIPAEIEVNCAVLAMKVTNPVTSQSPAVREILVAFTLTVEVNATPEALLLTNSPSLPAAALLFVVVPTMFGWFSVGVVPRTSKPVPVSSEITPASWADVVAANCDRLPEVSANVVPHDRPVPLVYFSALLAVLQLATANAAGAALEPVKLPSTVLAAIGANVPDEIDAHPGAELGPVDTIA